MRSDLSLAPKMSFGIKYPKMHLASREHLLEFDYPTCGIWNSSTECSGQIGREQKFLVRKVRSLNPS